MLVGMQVLPPSRTGHDQLVGFLRDEEVPEEVAADTWVYLTSDREAAEVFAAAYPLPSGGSVYAVEPQGEIEPDPDYLGEDGASVRCPAAEITSVVRVRLGKERLEHLRISLNRLAAEW
jgi:hypothetical protein